MMIWGDVINSVRSLHLEFLDQYSIHAAAFSTAFKSDVELTTDAFPFPTVGENFEEWETPPLPEKIQEALEFHSVERALVEGPLLPIQEIVLKNDEWDSLLNAILKLEKEWLTKTKLDTDDKYSFLEKNLQAKFIQLRRRHSAVGLRAV